MIRGIWKGLTSVSSKEFGKEIALGAVSALAAYGMTYAIGRYLEKRKKGQ